MIVSFITIKRYNDNNTKGYNKKYICHYIMSIKIIKEKDLTNFQRPSYVKMFYVTPKEKIQYHGTLHKEGDNACHIKADNRLRKTQKVMMGQFRNKFIKNYGKKKKYKKEVTKVYRFFKKKYCKTRKNQK